MEARTWFRISAAPVGAQLEALLEFAAARRAHYPTFLLVEREPAVLFTPNAAPPRDAASVSEKKSAAEGHAAELLETLAPALVTETRTDRWPGAPVERSANAKVRYYRLDRHAALALARVGSLDAFLAPLPEELCILASDKTPWLVSSARNRRHHLHLTREEERDLQKTLPWLQLVPEDVPPHE